ncbi:MAG: LysR family transcriptional regulator [Gammaproteobacteria bacterium]|nr:MAG: LysR family transcriptional regulator [Gammaproteobacteria bacterium]
MDNIYSVFLILVISYYLYLLAEYRAMNVTLRQLSVFESAARLLSYTRAAEELHLSQPAVSMQIRQLEEQAGLQLFEKLGRKLHLTEAGRELFQYSRAILNELHEAEEVLEALKGLNTGTLNIGVASTVNYFAPRLLAAFSHRYPGINLSLEATNRENLIHMLSANEKDLVLMGRPPEQIDLESEPFLENPLVVIAPPEHPLAKEHGIPLQRLAEETFVIREAGSGTRAAMKRFFSEQGITLKTGMQMTRNEAIKQAVRAGLGLSIVSIHSIELELETKRLVVLDVKGFPIKRQWFLVYRHGKRLSPAAGAFKDFVLAEAGSLLSLPGTEK